MGAPVALASGGGLVGGTELGLFIARAMAARVEAEEDLLLPGERWMR